MNLPAYTGPDFDLRCGYFVLASAVGRGECSSRQQFFHLTSIIPWHWVVHLAFRFIYATGVIAFDPGIRA